MNSHKEQMCEANAPKINDLLSSLSSLLTSIPNDIDPMDPTDQVKGNINMQQLLASMLTSMNGINKEGNNSQEQGSGNEEQGSGNQGQGRGNEEQESGNMQQILASMLTSMNGINKEGNNSQGQEGCNINDLFSKLLGNMKDTEETLDDDYILSGDGGGDCDCGDCDCGDSDCCDEEEHGDCCDGPEGMEGVLSEEDFKEMITSFNDVNMMSNLKVMFEMLSKKMPQPPTNANTITNMEDVD